MGHARSRGFPKPTPKRVSVRLGIVGRGAILATALAPRQTPGPPAPMAAYPVSGRSDSASRMWTELWVTCVQKHQMLYFFLRRPQNLVAFRWEMGKKRAGRCARQIGSSDPRETSQLNLPGLRARFFMITGHVRRLKHFLGCHGGAVQAPAPGRESGPNRVRRLFFMGP